MASPIPGDLAALIHLRRLAHRAVWLRAGSTAEQPPLLGGTLHTLVWPVFLSGFGQIARYEPEKHVQLLNLVSRKSVDGQNGQKQQDLTVGLRSPMYNVMRAA